MQPLVMHRALSVLAILASLGGCSSNPPAVEPKVDSSAEPSTEPPPKGDNDVPQDKPDITKGKVDNVVPDDYQMTPHDCEELSKQYGDVQRGDQVAALSPKLTAKQKEQAMANIEKAIAPIEDKWNDMCHHSLAGNVVDPKAIKCAMVAKTVNAFNVCFNGEAAPPPKK